MQEILRIRTDPVERKCDPTKTIVTMATIGVIYEKPRHWLQISTIAVENKEKMTVSPMLRFPLYFFPEMWIVVSKTRRHSVYVAPSSTMRDKGIINHPP